VGGKEKQRVVCLHLICFRKCRGTLPGGNQSTSIKKKNPTTPLIHWGKENARKNLSQGCKREQAQKTDPRKGGGTETVGSIKNRRWKRKSLEKKRGIMQKEKSTEVRPSTPRRVQSKRGIRKSEPSGPD